MPRFTDRQMLTELLLESYALYRHVEYKSRIRTEILSIDDSEESTSESEDEEPPYRMSTTMVKCIQSIHAKRYLEKRVEIPKSSETLHIILTVYKMTHPDLFRSYLRISPQTFDALLIAIHDDPIFHNNSQNEQAPVAIQLAVALYRFGHFGNAASLVKVGVWAGIGWGTADLYTRRVMAAVCCDRFRKSAIRWPNDEEIQEASDWVASQSCPAWGAGYLMVDGTPAVLHCRPGFYGNSFYDRKQKYSLNVQIVNTPDLRIRDYAIGLPGSQHDSTAWKDTRVYSAHATLLREGDFIWGDSAYPISSWVCAPYKASVVLNLQFVKH
jgi:hypothetical protein